MNNKFVYTPGPTRVRENVRLEIAKETTNPDIDVEFCEFYKNTCKKMSSILNTENDVYIFSGEGILGLEAACASLTEQGDKVLVIDNGIFGRGFDDFVKMYGGEVVYFSGDYTKEIDIEELEKFLDIYDPSLFNCKHTVFDRDIFLCIGEIIFDKGVDDVYDSMNEDELLDYLDILEKFKINSYNPSTNEYNITSTKDEFLNICECIPQSFSNKKYEVQDQDYQNKNYDEMSGLEFERYCGYLLQKNAFTDIKITQASGDHGIDILAEKAGISYAFQCKCYSDNVGNDAIQQAHTGKCLYHMDIAVVITNRYFTQHAQDEAKQLGVKLWDR